jgi:hypothetical protein
LILLVKAVIPTKSASSNSNFSKFSSAILTSQSEGVTEATYDKPKGGNVENLLKR